MFNYTDKGLLYLLDIYAYEYKVKIQKDRVQIKSIVAGNPIVFKLLAKNRTKIRL